MRITDFLCYGADHPITATDLKAATGWTAKQLRVSIHSERMAGTAICNSDRGYFLADTEEEKRRFVRSMRHRAGEIMRVAKAVNESTIPGKDPDRPSFPALRRSDETNPL